MSARDNSRWKASGIVIPTVIAAIEMVLISIGPMPVAASTFRIYRLGTYDADNPVRALDISEDGRWLLAGAMNAQATEGGLYLFDFDYLPSPIAPNWSNTHVVPYDDWVWGSSRPVAISVDGKYIVAGLKANSEVGANCQSNFTVGGCVQYYYHDIDANSVSLKWQKNLTSAVPSVDVATIIASSGSPAVAAGSGTYVKVYTHAGNLYWETTVSYTVHHVRLSRDGTYLAVSSIATQGYDSSVYFFKKNATAYALLWSYTGNAEVLNIDLSEDGLLLAAGEDHSNWNYAIPSNLTHFWPGTDGWDSGDGTPCMRYVKSDDIYAVAVAQNVTIQNATQISVRSLVGRSQGSDSYAEQHIVCDDDPSNQWTMSSFSTSVDMSVADCPSGTSCFGVAGGSDYYVSLFREGDSSVSRDRTGGLVHALVASHEYSPQIAAGSDDGYVYFYTAIVTP